MESVVNDLEAGPAPEKHDIRKSTLQAESKDQFREILITKGKIRKTKEFEQDNYILSTHYTRFNFIPLCLLEQLMQPANFYFLCIAILQTIPEVSTTKGSPTIAFPLIFIITISMGKVGYEEYNRSVEDQKCNGKIYTRLQFPTTDSNAIGVKPGQAVLSQVRSHEIRVGDILVIYDGEEVPADVILMGRFKKADEFQTKKYCHIETSNVDGETNLKVKMVPEGLNRLDHELVAVIQRGTKYEGEYDEFWERMMGYSKLIDPTFVKWLSIKPKRPRTSFACGTILGKSTLKFKIPPSDGELNAFKFATFHYRESPSVAEECIELSIDNLIPRGCVIVNSGYVYGLVIYVGKDCKLIKNAEASGSSKLKSGQLERVWSSYIFVYGCLMIICVVLVNIYASLWSVENDGAWYLNASSRSSTDFISGFFTLMIQMQAFVPISLYVSVELIKLMQMWAMQSDKNMIREIDGKELACQCKNTYLNDDLGRVEFVLSDKTGTLTENILTSRQCLVTGIGKLGGGLTQIAWMNLKKSGAFQQCSEDERLLMEAARISRKEAQYTLQTIANVDDAIRFWKNQFISSEEFVNMTKGTRSKLLDCMAQVNSKSLFKNLSTMEVAPPPDPDNYPDLYGSLFLHSLALNNDAFPVMDEETGKIVYNASTPDDICLVHFTKFGGVELCPFSKPYKTLKIKFSAEDSVDMSEVETWEELHLLKFSSSKKRMSVVCRLREINGRPVDDNKIFVFVKGADNVIYDLAHQDSQAYYDKYSRHTVKQFAAEGLRTLVAGFAIHSEQWWAQWEAKFKAPMSDEDVEELENEFDRECGYHICGVSAIEDLLQDQVPETVEKLKDAGIRVWMLTGDKRETAINIGIGCNLLSPGPWKEASELEDASSFEYDYAAETQYIVMNEKNCIDLLERFEVEKIKTPNIELVLQGSAVHEILRIHALRLEVSQDANIPLPPALNLLRKFAEFALSSRSTVSCRLHPDQKANIASIIMNTTGLVILAMGDGANDVPMIKTANVGVGLQGLEGTAAARNADYVISRFSHIVPLLFIHGRSAYMGTSKLILHLLWKSSLLSFNSIWFNIMSGWSAQVYMYEWFFQFINAINTGMFMLILPYDIDVHEDILLEKANIYSLTNGHQFEPRDIDSLAKVKEKRSRIIHFEGGAKLNLQSLFWATLEGFAVSLLVMIPISVVFQESVGFTSKGESWGFCIYGTIIYCSLVFIINLKIWFLFSVLTEWAFLWIGIHFLNTIIILILIDSLQYAGGSWFGQYYVGVYTYSMQTNGFWFILLCCLGVPAIAICFSELTTGMFGKNSLNPFWAATEDFYHTPCPWFSCRCTLAEDSNESTELEVESEQSKKREVNFNMTNFERNADSDFVNQNSMT